MSSSEPTIIGKVPGFARVREFLDGLAPRERALLMTLVITVLGLGMLGGAVYL